MLTGMDEDTSFSTGLGLAYSEMMVERRKGSCRIKAYDIRESNGIDIETNKRK